MPQFKFCFQLRKQNVCCCSCLLSAMIRIISSLHEVKTDSTPPPYFVPLVTWWYELSFPADKSFCHIVPLSFIMPSYDLSQLDMVCKVWEVCVFVHLSSCWMLSDVCSRRLNLICMLLLNTWSDYCTCIFMKHWKKQPVSNILKSRS